MSIAEVNRLAANLKDLGASAKKRIAIAARDEANALLEEEFDEGIDPDGEAWADLKPSTVRKGRTPPPLTDTHEMRDHVRARVVGSNVAIDSEDPAELHQGGTESMARRPIWPDGETLPERWDTQISFATTAVLVDEVKRAVE